MSGYPQQPATPRPLRIHTEVTSFWPVVVAFLIFIIMMVPFVIDWSGVNTADQAYAMPKGSSREQLKEQLLEQRVVARQRTFVRQ